MRARGLKHSLPVSKTHHTLVAPHAGAWVETRRWLFLPGGLPVAPHAGAWVETHFPDKLAVVAVVAPHAGAWVETCS